MGTASSKFCKYIKHGNEAAAVQLINSCSELHKAIDPNASYKGLHNNDTPLHCVCRHAMKSLVRYVNWYNALSFLLDLFCISQACSSWA